MRELRCIPPWYVGRWGGRTEFFDASAGAAAGRGNGSGKAAGKTDRGIPADAGAFPVDAYSRPPTTADGSPTADIHPAPSPWSRNARLGAHTCAKTGLGAPHAYV